ncbi:MAG: GNAT family N-acetyltransferase [Paracoccus sp. (in: a-proteobacteria)]
MGRTRLVLQEIRIEAGLRPEHRAQVALGYWSAFSRKIRYPLGPKDKAIAFIERVMDPLHAISAISQDGEFLGVAGFKTPRGAFIGGNFDDMAQVYGWFGAIFRSLLVAALERDCKDNILLMDGLFVQKNARGLGVGGMLLDAVEQYAVMNGLKRVRLDVVDSNPRARSLYERHGFEAGVTQSMGILEPVFGFKNVTTMTKPVGGRGRSSIYRRAQTPVRIQAELRSGGC